MNLISFELIFVADHNSGIIRTDIHRTIRVTVRPICTYQLRSGTKYKGPFILCTSSNRINAKLCSGLRFHLEYIFEVLSMSDVSLDYRCQTVKGSPRTPHFRCFFLFFCFFLCFGYLWFNVSFSNISATVNAVIFAGGKFRENVGKTFHVGVIFTILLHFPS